MLLCKFYCWSSKRNSYIIANKYIIIRIRIPWAPKTFIFRCYKLVITHILGFKTFIFHGFGVQGYICLSPSEFPKKFHLASTKHPKYHKTRNSLKLSNSLHFPHGKINKKLLIPPTKTPPKKGRRYEVRSPSRFGNSSSGHGSYQSTVAQLMSEGNLGFRPLPWWKSNELFVNVVVPGYRGEFFFEMIFWFVWTKHQFSGWFFVGFQGSTSIHLVFIMLMAATL